MEGSMKLRDGEFKDESPLKTVEKIKGILRKYGIETEERWQESKVPYCHAMSVRVVGTTFRVNGKGLTREFAMASGYGELMERLQLGYVGGESVQKDGDYSVNDSQDELHSVQSLLANNEPWYEAMALRLHEASGVRKKTEELLRQFADRDGMVAAAPYISLSTGKRVYFPTAIRKRVYSTNGCAAGNSMEEALVQGISEIVERHYHKRIVEEEITLPDIPEARLQQCCAAYDIITYVRAQGFRVTVKDCSLGGKFPVVCVCFVDERSGRYHTHFGAYPVFEIALQRALTESFQGRDIENFANFDGFLYKRADARSLVSIANEMTKGTWEKQTSFFVGNPQYPYHDDIGLPGANNRELLKACVDFFAEQGVELLVRDCSCLGFPTYQILAPGYSEIFTYRLSPKLDDHRYFAHAGRALRNPSAAGFDDWLGLLMHISQMQNFSKNISDVHGFRSAASLSAELPASEDRRLLNASLAYIYYAIGKQGEVLKYLDSMIDSADQADAEYLICLKRYLSMEQHRYEKDEIDRVLQYFHRPKTVKKLYDCLAQKRNPLEQFTLHCDMTCKADCMLRDCCCQSRVKALSVLIGEKTKELDFEAFSCRLQQLL